MTLTTKDDYLKASNRLATGFGPTVDFVDPQIGTTVQSEGGVPTSAADLPGQVFSVDQLPDPAVATAYGLPPVRVPAHLILDDEADAVRHVQAKSADDIVNGQLREELGNPVLGFDNVIRPADDSLKQFDARTGAGLSLSEGERPEDDRVFVDGILGGDGQSTTSDAAADGPIDPEGVQADPATGRPVSEEAGNQGEKVSEAPGGSNGEQTGDGQQKEPDAAPDGGAGTPDAAPDEKPEGRAGRRGR